jgi:hypothetical protein
MIMTMGERRNRPQCDQLNSHTHSQAKLTQKILLVGRREGLELILISLVVVGATAIDSLVRVRVHVVGRIVVIVMNEFIIIPERLLLITRKIILLEILE